jgi:predicted transcriptional regulator
MKDMTAQEVEAFLKMLDDAPVKEKSHYSAKEVLTTHRARILKQMADKNLDHEDIARLMAGDGEGITGGTVRTYLRGDSIKKANANRKRKPKAERQTRETVKADAVESVPLDERARDSEDTKADELDALLLKMGESEAEGKAHGQ